MKKKKKEKSKKSNSFYSLEFKAMCESEQPLINIVKGIKKKEKKEKETKKSMKDKDVKKMIKHSIENMVCTRLESVISRESVIIDSRDISFNSTTNLLSEIEFIERICSNIDDPETYTIAHIVQKKDACKIFNDDNILANSSLNKIYDKVKSKWKKLNEGKNNFTNVLFIPDILVYDIKSHPVKVNLLIIAEPKVSHMCNHGIGKMEDADVIKRYVNDTIDACVKLGVKKLIVDPYPQKIMRENEYITAKSWVGTISSQRVIEHMNSVDFCVFDSDLYTIFLRQGPSINVTTF